jgi:hypothetical protein
MKAREVIQRLTKLVEEHGDLPVVTYDGMDPSDLCESNEVCKDTATFFSSPDGAIIDQHCFTIL